MRRLINGISGASGAIYGIRALQALKEIAEIETHLVKRWKDPEAAGESIPCIAKS